MNRTLTDIAIQEGIINFLEVIDIYNDANYSILYKENKETVNYSLFFKRDILTLSKIFEIYFDWASQEESRTRTYFMNRIKLFIEYYLEEDIDKLVSGFVEENSNRLSNYKIVKNAIGVMKKTFKYDR